MDFCIGADVFGIHLPSVRTLLWYRGKDLRITDHGPLRDAMKHGEVVPVFVLDPVFFTRDRAQKLPHRMQFLLQGLQELRNQLQRRGSDLLLARGKSTLVIPRLVQKWRIDRVVAHRWSEPFGRERDRRIAESLRVPFVLFEGETLLPPGILRSGSHRPYAVFTPFARAFEATFSPGSSWSTPKSIPPLPKRLRVSRMDVPTLKTLGLTTNAGLQTGGESMARRRFRSFLAGPGRQYHRDRDRMDRAGTSRLSADIKFGTISVRTIWNGVTDALGTSRAAHAFRNELIWREFAHSTMWDFPHVFEQPFRTDFAKFPWESDEHLWRAWVEGTTGYPVVDAASRQLLAEGFVHNRARMIAASFLCKHLLIDYRRGEAHYLKFLTDADWSNNNMGWQWSAGCGCDAQPYFRVFNPVLQGKKFDPDGDYVRRWVPELTQVPTRWIHQPWSAPESVLAKAGVLLDRIYPRPIVDHTVARHRFLQVARDYLTKSRKR